MAKKAKVTGNGGKLFHFFPRHLEVTLIEERVAIDDGHTPIFEFEGAGMKQGLLREHFEWIDEKEEN